MCEDGMWIFLASISTSLAWFLIAMSRHTKEVKAQTHRAVTRLIKTKVIYKSNLHLGLILISLVEVCSLTEDIAPLLAAVLSCLRDMWKKPRILFSLMHNLSCAQFYFSYFYFFHVFFSCKKKQMHLDVGDHYFVGQLFLSLSKMSIKMSAYSCITLDHWAMEAIQVQAIQPFYFKVERKKINQYMKSMNVSDLLNTCCRLLWTAECGLPTGLISTQEYFRDSATYKCGNSMMNIISEKEGSCR